MRNKNISITKDIVKEREGVAILDLARYMKLKEKLEEYQKKEKLLKGLEKFENLAKWGRTFAKKRKITQSQVLEND